MSLILRIIRSSSEIRLSSLFLVTMLTLGIHAQELDGWDLVWSDEFTQVDGSTPDPSKWGYDLGGGGWGNQELQYYTDRPENARIENNQLLIEAHEESYGGRNHTSARLLTKGKWDWTYGRFETRVKVPSGAGLWPACWMLGADIDSVGWPQCGEIDIMEQVGRLPKEIFGTIHGPGYSGGESIGNTYTFAADVSDAYHVFVVEWDENLIRWFVDGIHYFTATPQSLGGDSWVFDHNHFMLLNLAVGGNFAGALDESVVFPQQYWVDYVRVYTRTPDAGSNLLVNPGFESGGLGAWTGFAPGGANEAGGYVESSANSYYNGGNPGGDPVATRSGAYVGKVFGDFTGSTNDNGFFQELVAEAGSTWGASGWAMTHPQDQMSGDNEAWVEVLFLDASDTVLSIHRSEVLDASSAIPGQWAELRVTDQIDPQTGSVVGSDVTMVAPEGTSKVRYVVVHRQPEYGGGSVYLDDLSLFIEPEPADFKASIEPGVMVSWTPQDEEATHQLQKSSDNVGWEDWGEEIAGGSPASRFDESPAAFYRVIETGVAGVANGVANPGFETGEPAVHPSPGAVGWTIAAPEDVDPSDGLASMTIESSYLSSSPHGGSNMLVMRSTTPPSPAAVVVPNTNVRSGFIAVEESTMYDVSFYAAHLMKVGGANPQFNIRYYDVDFLQIGQSGYESFASIGSSWTKIERGFETIADTRWVVLEWIQALGAGNEWDWVTLIDDVDLPTESGAGSETILLAVSVSGHEVSWLTTPGVTYQVEESTDLESWLNLGPSRVGDGSVFTETDIQSSPKQFYRVNEVTVEVGP